MTKTITINVLEWDFEYGVEGYHVRGSASADADTDTDTEYSINSQDGEVFDVDFEEDGKEEHVATRYLLSAAIEAAQIDHAVRVTAAAMAARLVELALPEMTAITQYLASRETEK